jgi:hypothetical protein
VPVRDAAEADDAIEHPPRPNEVVEDMGQQRLDVRTNRLGTAGS